MQIILSLQIYKKETGMLISRVCLVWNNILSLPNYVYIFQEKTTSMMFSQQMTLASYEGPKRMLHIAENPLYCRASGKKLEMYIQQSQWSRISKQQLIILLNVWELTATTLGTSCNCTGETQLVLISWCLSKFTINIFKQYFFWNMYTFWGDSI